MITNVSPLIDYDTLHNIADKTVKKDPGVKVFIIVRDKQEKEGTTDVISAVQKDMPSVKNLNISITKARYYSHSKFAAGLVRSGLGIGGMEVMLMSANCTETNMYRYKEPPGFTSRDSIHLLYVDYATYHSSYLSPIVDEAHASKCLDTVNVAELPPPKHANSLNYSSGREVLCGYCFEPAVLRTKFYFVLRGCKWTCNA
jgi:hypothetical protein